MLFAQQTLAQPFISSVQFDHNKGIELLRPSCSYSQLKNGMSGCTDAVREIQQGGEYQYLKSTQLVVRLNGSTPLPHSSYRLNVELIVHGGLWRTSSHQLCTSLEVQPNNELRECSRRIGPFVAAINVHIPGPLPRSRTLLSAQHHQRLDAYAVRMGHLAAAAKSIADIDVCSLDAAVLSQTVTKHACRRRGFQQSRLNGSIRMGVPELMASLKSSGLVETNLLREDWLPIATAFATAALSLPQPFTMVEVGNYCGAQQLNQASVRLGLTDPDPLAAAVAMAQVCATTGACAPSARHAAHTVLSGTAGVPAGRPLRAKAVGARRVMCSDGPSV